MGQKARLDPRAALSGVKLLLDENLSRRLVPALQARFPGTSQLALLGLERAADAQICAHAAQHDFVVCSKDDDFQRLVAARGYRPRLIHLALGNVCQQRCSADRAAGRG
jgi:predicted nuclease of predicted toxin-antitoxin system